MTGEKKTCGANTKAGTGPCRQTIINPQNGRCKVHGGPTPKGTASPQFRSGFYASTLPRGIAAHFAHHDNDPQLLKLRQDIALVTSTLTTFLSRLRDTGRPMTARQERRMLDLIEERRRLIEGEGRRLKDLQQMVTKEQFRTTLSLCLTLFREFVKDPRALQEIQRRMRGLLPPTTTDDPNTVH